MILHFSDNINRVWINRRFFMSKQVCLDCVEVGDSIPFQFGPICVSSLELIFYQKAFVGVE